MEILVPIKAEILIEVCLELRFALTVLEATSKERVSPSGHGFGCNFERIIS